MRDAQAAAKIGKTVAQREERHVAAGLQSASQRNPVDVAAAIPVVTLLVLIATGAVRTHIAAIIALVAAILVAVFLFTMPAGLAIRSAILGAITGFFPIGWIVLNFIFMYRLTVATGRFDTLQQAIGGVSADRRIQLLLIAF